MALKEEKRASGKQKLGRLTLRPSENEKRHPGGCRNGRSRPKTACFRGSGQVWGAMTLSGRFKLIF